MDCGGGGQVSRFGFGGGGVMTDLGKVKNGGVVRYYIRVAFLSWPDAAFG